MMASWACFISIKAVGASQTFSHHRVSILSPPSSSCSSSSSLILLSSNSVQTPISWFWEEKITSSHQWITLHCTPTLSCASWLSCFESLYLILKWSQDKNLWVVRPREHFMYLSHFLFHNLRTDFVNQGSSQWATPVFVIRREVESRTESLFKF